MDVCVVGAGIGGLALAQGLAADGHQVRVIERGDGPARGGAAVTIFCNGAAAASGLGVGLGELGGDIRLLEMRRSTGRMLMRTDLHPMREATGFGVRTVPRADLIRRLGEDLDADVLYGSAVQSVRFDRTGVVVETTDGRAHRADAVVGADGARSTVRASVLADGAPRAVGWSTFQGLSPILPEVAAGTTGFLVVGGAGLVGLMPAGDGLTQWWFDVRHHGASAAADGAAASRRWLHDRFASYGEPVPELLATMEDADMGCYPHVLRDPGAPWGRGAVTLLGDAAHAFPPSQAQGANQALEDAWCLRRVLADPSGNGVGVSAKGAETVPEALRRYERRRARRVRLISRMAASERTNLPPGALLGTLARATPAGVAGRAYLRLLRRVSDVLHDA